jgi:Prohead core protein serine protease
MQGEIMRLIKECTEDVRYLTEEDTNSGKKSYFIEGIFLQADITNKNKRQYCFESLNREVNRYANVYIKANRAFGELGHPDSPTINLERVSHMIKELHPDGKNFYGKAKILTETPYGKIVQTLLDEEAKIGVSTRGLGSVVQSPDGVYLVQDDFTLATAADIVADPSAPDAFVRGIMENREWVLIDGRYVGKDIEIAKATINKASSRQLYETCVSLFEDYLNALAGNRRK